MVTLSHGYSYAYITGVMSGELYQCANMAHTYSRILKEQERAREVLDY